MTGRTRRKKVAVTADMPTVVNALNALEQRVFDQEGLVTKATENLILLENRMKDAETRLGTSETLTNETAKLLADLTTKVSGISTNVTAIGQRVDTTEEDIHRSAKGLLSTRLIVNNHMDRMEKFDADDRAKTLIVEGLSEPFGQEDLRKFLDDLFKDLGLNYGNEKCEFIYRRGKRQAETPNVNKDGGSTKSRPIVVKLQHRSTKGEIFRNIRFLHDKPGWQGISLMDDLTARERKQYNDLRAIFFLAKKSGKIRKVKLRQRSVLINDRAYQHSDLDALPFGLNMWKATTIKTADGLGFRSEYNPLSNLYPCEVWYKNMEYTSTEQAYQHDKATTAGNAQAATDIMAAEDPYVIMKLGADVKPTQEWNKGATKLMYKLVSSKFQPVHMRDILLKTGKNRLYELTYDKTYGAGRHLGNARNLCHDNTTGGNILGLLLEKVRAECKLENNQAMEPGAEPVDTTGDQDVSNPWDIRIHVPEAPQQPDDDDKDEDDENNLPTKQTAPIDKQKDDQPVVVMASPDKKDETPPPELPASAEAESTPAPTTPIVQPVPIAASSPPEANGNLDNAVKDICSKDSLILGYLESVMSGAMAKGTKKPAHPPPKPSSALLELMNEAETESDSAIQSRPSAPASQDVSHTSDSSRL